MERAATKTHTGGNTTLNNTVRPRETTSHGFVTPDNHPVAYGRPRGTTGYHGRPRETTGDHGPGRCDLGNDSLAYGRPWETTEDHERPGETTGDHGRPRETTGDHGPRIWDLVCHLPGHRRPQETTGDHGTYAFQLTIVAFQRFRTKNVKKTLDFRKQN